MAESGGAPEKRFTAGMRLRKYIDVVVEDKLSYMLFRGAIADISAFGMRLISDQYLPKGTKYTFSMKKPPFMVLLGEVRWVRTFERETFQVGVLFVDMSEEETRRLGMFLDLERRRVPLTTGDA